MKKSLAEAAKAACLEHHLETMAGRPGNSLQYRIAKSTGRDKHHEIRFIRAIQIKYCKVKNITKGDRSEQGCRSGSRREKLKNNRKMQ